MGTDNENRPNGSQTVGASRFDGWIPGCPVVITEAVVTEDGGKRFLTVTAERTAGSRIKSILCDIVLYDAYRTCVGRMNDVDVIPDERITLGGTTASYADIDLKKVKFEDGSEWDSEGIKPEKLPGQKRIWQSDPYYARIKALCSGTVSAEYYPDEIAGGWRCACGALNVKENAACVSCGCEKEWLDDHFDDGYLGSLPDSGTEIRKELKNERIVKREKEGRLSDRQKAAIITAAALLVVILAVVFFTAVLPSMRYERALELLEKNRFDEAYAVFDSLGPYRDSAVMKETTLLLKYRYIIGSGDVYITTSEKEPYFSITEDGELNFRRDRYDGPLRSLRIPDVVDGIIVRTIAKSGFINASFSKITLPDSLWVIGEQAFMNNKSLKRLDFGKGVTEIGPRAFVNCSALTEMEIPDHVTSLGSRAFNNCVSLKSIVIGSGIETIGPYTFSNCSSLETVEIHSRIKSIGEGAFADCDSLKKVTVTNMGRSWIENCTIGEGNSALYEAAE